MRIGVLRTAFSDFLTKRRHVDEVLFWAKPEKVDAQSEVCLPHEAFADCHFTTNDELAAMESFPRSACSGFCPTTPRLLVGQKWKRALLARQRRNKSGRLHAFLSTFFCRFPGNVCVASSCASTFLLKPLTLTFFAAPRRRELSKKLHSFNLGSLPRERRSWFARFTGDVPDEVVSMK